MIEKTNLEKKDKTTKFPEGLEFLAWIESIQKKLGVNNYKLLIFLGIK